MNIDLSKKTKESIQFIFATLTLIAGVTLLFLGFYAVPIGEISTSVISSAGLLLAFVGAVWNIDLKYTFKTKEFEARYLQELKEREKIEE